jgi:hypothetical protein
MIGERNTHISDINNKYFGTRQGTVRSHSFITPQLGAPPGAAGTTVTYVGPVSTLGSIPAVATATGSINGSPMGRRLIEAVDTQTPGFDSGAVQTQQPAEYWDNDVDGKVRTTATGTSVRKVSCFEKCSTNCPSICGCPWWVALLLGLLTFGAIIAGLMASSRTSASNSLDNASTNVTNAVSNQVNQLTDATDSAASNVINTSTNVTDSKETTTDRKEILNCN